MTRPASFPAMPGAFWRSLVLAAVLLAAFPDLACRGQAPLPPRVLPASLPDSTFAGLIERFSESEGYFDTDNLISNEASYQHVLGVLARHGVAGGAYLGVGPDQNFTYIAQIEPEIAFLVDIRRDNLLQHLLFKALFTLAPTRIEFLSLLFGRPPPPDTDAWYEASAPRLAGYLDAASPRPDADPDSTIRRTLDALGLGLSDEDYETIGRIHRAFQDNGLDLRFSSHFREPRPYYPTFRQLLLETDREGVQRSYLASEARYRVVRDLQLRNRVIPVVGDLAGARALPAIAAYLREHGLEVSAYYTSNVEFYVMREGRFDRFAANVEALPRMDHGVVIRSYFNRWQSSHPHTVSGYASTQLAQPLNRLVEHHRRGGFRSYWDLITDHALDPD